MISRAYFPLAADLAGTEIEELPIVFFIRILPHMQTDFCRIEQNEIESEGIYASNI